MRRGGRAPAGFKHSDPLKATLGSCALLSIHTIPPRGAVGAASAGLTPRLTPLALPVGALATLAMATAAAVSISLCKLRRATFFAGTKSVTHHLHEVDMI